MAAEVEKRGMTFRRPREASPPRHAACAQGPVSVSPSAWCDMNRSRLPRRGRHDVVLMVTYVAVGGLVTLALVRMGVIR